MDDLLILAEGGEILTGILRWAIGIVLGGFWTIIVFLVGAMSQKIGLLAKIPIIGSVFANASPVKE